MVNGGRLETLGGCSQVFVFRPEIRTHVRYDAAVFEVLAAEIESLPVGLDTDALVAAFGLFERFTVQLTDWVGEVDRSQLWGVDGTTSMTAWVAAHTASSRQMARRFTGRASLLHRLPVTAATYEAGLLSTAQVDLIVAVVKPEYVQLFAEHEEELVPTLSELTPCETERALAVWVRHAEAIIDTPEDRERAEAVHFSISAAGRGRLDASLNNDHTAALEQAMRLAETLDGEGETQRSASQRRADAFNDIVAFFLANHTKPAGVKNRSHLNVVLTLEELTKGLGGQTLSGLQLQKTLVEQLCCDSIIHYVVVGQNSEILDYGTGRRLVSPGLFKVVEIADRCCRFPGCDRPATWCDAHHVKHWTDGGPTSLRNLVLLCNRHHHLIHRAGWNVELAPDRTLTVITPTGRRLIGRPPPGMARTG